MGKPIYITDPVVAAAYHVHPGEFAYVADDTEAFWLVANHHGYPLNYGTALPAAYFVHAAAPAFVPFPEATTPDTQPALMTVTTKQVAPNVFDVIFGDSVDTAQATGAFLGIDGANAIVGKVTWVQPPGSTPDQAAALLKAALVPHVAKITTTQFGPRLEVRGAGVNVLQAIRASLRVPKVAAPAPTPPAPPPPASPPPPPAPAPATTIAVGAEDTVTKIDVDGDGRADVLIVTDRPPQNP